MCNTKQPMLCHVKENLAGYPCPVASLPDQYSQLVWAHVLSANCAVQHGHVHNNTIDYGAGMYGRAGISNIVLLRDDDHCGRMYTL